MVDYTYYKDTYGGSGSEEEITPLLSCAERIVRGCLKEDPPSYAETAYKTAVCIQADFLESAESCGGYSSVSLGSFSASGMVCGNRFTAGLCGEAAAVLDSAGLFYRGTEV